MNRININDVFFFLSYGEHRLNLSSKFQNWDFESVASGEIDCVRMARLIRKLLNSHIGLGFTTSGKRRVKNTI